MKRIQHFTVNSFNSFLKKIKMSQFSGLRSQLSYFGDQKNNSKTYLSSTTLQFSL